MKRILIALLAACCVSFGAVAASAAEGTLTDANKAQDIDVTVNYHDGTIAPEVYSVDIMWDEMSFTYNASGAIVWDSTTHQYVDNTTGAWGKDSAKVEVTNHSNKAVEVDVKYTADGDTGVIAQVDNPSFTIDSAVGKAIDDAALTKVATIKVSGIPAERTAENLKIGTVTVEIK